MAKPELASGFVFKSGLHENLVRHLWQRNLKLTLYLSHQDGRKSSGHGSSRLVDSENKSLLDTIPDVLQSTILSTASLLVVEVGAPS